MVRAAVDGLRCAQPILRAGLRPQRLAQQPPSRQHLFLHQRPALDPALSRHTATQARLPSIGAERYHHAGGALLTYGVDIAGEYAGERIRNPFGKASGQLSLNVRQVRRDAEAGLVEVARPVVRAKARRNAIWMSGRRRGHMVMQAAGFVVGEDEGR